MMVEQEVLDLLAEEAPPEPEKVQVVALSSSVGAAVGAGTGAGAPKTNAAPASRNAVDSWTMVAEAKCLEYKLEPGAKERTKAKHSSTTWQRSLGHRNVEPHIYSLVSISGCFGFLAIWKITFRLRPTLVLL